ncbi:hypothetical protein HYV80_00540 [Candidatus Woesearchaeota archaeon]|nr:hypothetical protein [Candidatus Woesearchaeota archaeon]
MTSAFVRGFQRATLDDRVAQAPNDSGKEIRKATEIDAEATGYGRLRRMAFAAGNALGALYNSFPDYQS